jgi:hypothetical protein
MKRFLRLTAILLSGWTIGLITIYAFLDASAREADWRAERNCRYYGEQINAHAESLGKPAPCGGGHETR